MARKRRGPRRLLRFAIAVLLLAAIVASLYVIRLDELVVHQFEGTRWTLPAQVYATPLELYAGLELSPAELQHELQRLRYRRVVPEPTQSGTYRQLGARTDIALRAARFADETRPAQTLSVISTGTAISSLADATGHELPVARLEPLLIGSIFPIHGEDRIVVTPDEVPALLPAALKAVEDRNFDTHHGVDPWAILRALWIDARAGQLEQGGSTLTQQLVKSYFLDPRRTASRKLREAIMAMALEAHFSKADLMNAYINEIHLGQDGNRAIHGFGLASQFYFGKPLAELDLGEIATLVAIARGPSYYDPRRHADRALKRRNLVLKLMAEQNVVTSQQAQQATSHPLGVTPRAEGAYYPAYLDLVRRTLRRDYREEDLTEQGLRIYTNLDPRVQEQAEQTLDHELGRLDRQHRQKDAAQLQGAVVVTAPQSGDVIALVGGRDVGYDGFNRALDARRPMGSLVKPFIYLAALESGHYNATSIVQDVPVSIPLAHGKTWQPENFTHETNGPVPLVRALAESLNLATVNLGMGLGLDTVAGSLKRFGLEQEPIRNPSLLLGALDLTPLEVAQLYSGLANGGFRATLRAVHAVVSADGKALKAFPVEVQQVAQPDAVYAVDRMLVQVMQRGTGKPARAVLPPDLTVAGKSGTSSDLRDSWFAGFSGSDLLVVWIGYDDDRVSGFTGSSGALTVWSHLMANLHANSWNAPLPESLEEVAIDYPTGARAVGSCGADPVTVVVPHGTQLPQCNAAADSLLQRAGKWLHGLSH
jgi:penicillin-binding protein 1B